MSAPFGAFGLIFSAAFLLSLALTPLARKAGLRLGLVAEPGGRRRHLGKVPTTGSLPIFAAFVATVLLAQFLTVSPWSAPSGLPVSFQIDRLDPKEIFRLAGLLVGCTIILLMGLIDDWKELPPLPLFISQITAAGVAIAFLIIIEYVNNPLTGLQTEDFPYLITVTITLLWLGATTNTVNWLDGVDGLAAGVVAIACAVLFLNSAFRLDPPQYSVAIFPLALLGALLGFLPFNFFPARIFLGSGAYLIGFALGILSIIGGAKAASILMVLGLPLLDTAWQIINRLARGRNPAVGDRGHLHFRLIDIGLSQRQITLVYYLFCALFGGLSLLIPSQLYKFLALLVMAILTIAGFIWLAKYQPPPPPGG
ncbi:MAG: undecaprenyl/decaprenyl-phosphate alpha-N-acetylglucosaminyl 1-phosphate transferase [Anaerolineae bacterium]|nr:undecaprenyl/decaprenyl-phosphate alpha-N-acetylglucosaminyl 1-phosphate transferase [Anaerolineae bacterium]